MTKWDEIGRAFGTHDSTQLCYRENVALFDSTVSDQCERFGLHGDRDLGCRPSLGDVLLSDVDHARIAIGIEVREFSQVGLPSRVVESKSMS